MLRGGEGYLGFFIQPSLLALGAEVDQHPDQEGKFYTNRCCNAAPKLRNIHLFHLRYARSFKLNTMPMQNSSPFS